MDARLGAIVNDVDQLSKILTGKPAEISKANTYVDQLVKSINPRIPSQINVEQAKRILIEGNPDAKAFLRKYSELKVQNIRELDPLVKLLSKIKQKSELMEKLRQLNDEQPYDGSILESDNPDYETLEQLQMQIQGSESSTYHQLNNSKPLGSSYGLLDSSTLSSTTVKSKDSKNRRRKQPDSFLYNVPYLSDDFLPANLLTSRQPTVIPLETLPLSAQEKLVVQDLVACLQGYDGVYVKALKVKDSHAERKFIMDEKMHPSLKDTVNQVVSLISQYSLLVRFVEEKSRYEYGRVNQALAEGLHELLQHYRKLVCHLDTLSRRSSPPLGISHLLLLLKDTGHLFEALASLVSDINMGECVGGATLSLLHEAVVSAAAGGRVRACLLHLLRLACVPFLEALALWIFRGALRREDEAEFFIARGDMPSGPTGSKGEDRQAWEYVDAANVWERSYVIVSTQLPTFLESQAQRILATGKYLNVVQQCDSTVELAEPEALEFTESEQELLAPINRAYAFASRALLDFILSKKDLKGILRSIKRYFLLEKGDFIVHFMDTAADELKKNASQVSMSTLNSLLEWVLQSSSASADPYKDNLTATITNSDLINHMLTLYLGSENNSNVVDMNLTALEAFSLDYRVEWPNSLVANRIVLDRYQLLFRHLFHCRHVEQHLTTSWAMLKTVRGAAAGGLGFNGAFILVQRMLHFIQHLQYYMTFEVIEPAWNEFFAFLDKANNVDEVLAAQEQCLQVCMDDCLLTSPQLMTLVGKINAVCVQFVNNLSRILLLNANNNLEGLAEGEGPLRRGLSTLSLSSSSSSKAPSLFKGVTGGGGGGGGNEHGDVWASIPSTNSFDIRRRVAAADLESVSLSDGFEATMEGWSSRFNQTVCELLFKIKRPLDRKGDKLLSLAARLDYNGFYTRFMQDTAMRGSATYNSLAGGGFPRSASSMSSLTTLENTMTPSAGAAEPEEVPREPTLPLPPPSRRERTSGQTSRRDLPPIKHSRSTLLSRGSASEPK